MIILLTVEKPGWGTKTIHCLDTAKADPAVAQELAAMRDKSLADETPDELMASLSAATEEIHHDRDEIRTWHRAWAIEVLAELERRGLAKPIMAVRAYL